MDRINFFKRLFLLSVSGAAVPELFASVSEKQEEPISESFIFLTKPYLQFPLSDAMTIMWLTNNNGQGWVEYGLSEDLLTNTAIASQHGLVQANSRINKIRLTSLAPETTYYYRVGSKEIIDLQAYSVTFGEVIYSQIYSFVTPKLDEKETKMVIMNDVHNKNGTFETLLRSVKGFDYDFVFLNGDMQNDLKDEARILNMLESCTNNFATNKPFINSIGNHEKRGAFSRSFQDYIALPDERNTYYTFSRGPVFFIVLDTGEDKADSSSAYFGLVSSDSFRKKQVPWLEEQLQSESSKTAKYTVVIMHIPPYYSDCYASTQCAEIFSPLFEKYEVDLVISGHTHVRKLYLPNSSTEHKYPLLIGGGKDPGTRSIIKLTATETLLEAELLNDIGMSEAIFQTTPKDITSLYSEKMNTFEISTENGLLTIKGIPSDKKFIARVHSLSGKLILEETIPSSGVITVSRLSKDNYILSIIERKSGLSVYNSKFYNRI